MALVLLVVVLLLCGAGRTEGFTNSTNSTDCFSDSDVVFLVDGSGSVSPSDFRNIKHFIRSVVSRLSLGPNRTRVGLVKFSDVVSPVIRLDQGHDRTLLDQELTGMPLEGGGTLTGNALQFVVREFLTNSSRSRVLILITDGDPQDDVTPAVQELRRLGVQTYVIGFKDAHFFQMSLIASSPRHLFLVPSSDNFPSVLQRLCSADPPCDTAAKADIVLVLGGNWSFGQEKEESILIMNLISRLVSVLDIGPERVQIGLVQFSEDSRTEWLLNSHPNKDSLLQAVSSLQYKRGKSSSGRALDYLLQNHFCPNAGLRDDARKIGVFITDQTSQNEIMTSSKSLRDSGVQLYTIVLPDMNKLSSIASDPVEFNVFYFHEYTSPFNIVDDVALDICNKGAWPVVTSGPTPPLPSVSSGWVSPPPPLGPLWSVGAPPQDGGPVLVQWGLDFSVSCFVKPHSLDGYFLLLTPFGNHTLPAANHSARFLFPPFSSAHWGPYTCVYLLQVGCRNLTFHGPALRLKPGVSVSELLIRAAVIVILLLIYTIALYFYCYYYYRPKLQQSSTRGQRGAPTRASELSLQEL